MAQLSEVLSVFIPNLKVKLNEYAEAVSDIGNDSVIKGGLKLIKLSLTDSTEQQYDKIKTILEESKLKVLVFIDDTDRLSSDEIFEVFRLVRNTANFPYQQFLITYDRDYLLKMLKIESPGKYLEKIFNLEISLPAFDSLVIRESLMQEFTRCSVIDESQLEGIREFLTQFDDNFPVEQIIRNQRDVIRFANAFSLNVEAFISSLGNCTLEDIDILDFVKLELIRYRYPNEYNTLALAPLEMLDISKTNNDTFINRQKNLEADVNTNTGVKSIHDIDPENLFENDEEKNPYNFRKYIKQNDLLDACMNNLFPQFPANRKKSVSKIRSFDQDFRYRFDKKNISEAEIILLLQESDKTIQLQLLEGYFSSKKKREIFIMVESILSQFNEKSWREEEESPFYYKNVLSLFYTALESKSRKLVKEVVDSCSPIFSQSLYFDLDYYLEILRLWDRIMEFDMLVDGSIMVAFIYKNNLVTKLKRGITQKDPQKIETFLRKSVSLVQMSNLLNLYVDPDNNSHELILRKSLLKEIQLSYFMKYAESNKVDERSMYLFVNCAEKEQQTRNYLWNEEATKRVRSLIDDDVKGYIDLFIVYDNFYLYPPKLWKAIFNNELEELDAYLKAHDKVDGIKYANLVWNISKENDLNEVNTNHLLYINDEKFEFLRHLEKDYNNLLDIKIKVETIVENDNENITEAIKRLNEHRKELDSHPLRIRLTGDLIDKIDKYINENPPTN